jgi:hypothetical protein
MQISLRSQLVAGVGAVVVAGASAVTPVAATQLNLPVPSAAQFALTGYANPLAQIGLTAQQVADNLFNYKDIDGDYAWLPLVGMVPEFLNKGIPAIRQIGYNGQQYLGIAGKGLQAGFDIIVEAAKNLPSAVITATKQLFSGDISGAIKTLTVATVGPVVELWGAASSVINVIGSSVVTNLIKVIDATRSIGEAFLHTATGSASALWNAAVTVVNQTLAALGGGNPQLVWNTVVDGLLGPVGADGSVGSSIPGTALAVSIGAGLGPLGNPRGYELPSFRMWIEKSRLMLANATGALYPVGPTPLAVPAGATRAARTAAPVAAVTPVATVTKVDVATTGAKTEAATNSPATTGGSAATPKAGKHGATRRAAKAAS